MSKLVGIAKIVNHVYVLLSAIIDENLPLIYAHVDAGVNVRSLPQIDGSSHERISYIDQAEKTKNSSILAALFAKPPPTNIMSKSKCVYT